MTLSYCRLAVILAKQAHTAVIFRKGPSLWVQIILWHTDSDTFEAGQWFHGQIFHNWSDLSPDGSRLIYYASKARIIKTVDPEYTASWTAISKPPYLTALALWPTVSGGYFGNNKTVYLQWWTDNPPSPYRKHLPPSSLKVLLTNEGFNRNRYEPPLKHQGWVEVQRTVRIDSYGNPSYSNYPVPGIWHKDRDEYRIIMREFGFKWKGYGGPQLYDFTLQHIYSGVETVIDTDTWADWDQQGRLVYINQGRILAGEIDNGIITPRVLGDFNANKPEGIISPDWARVWD